MARTSNSISAFLLALRQSILDVMLTESTVQIITEERYLQYSPGQYNILIIPGACRAEDQGGEGENETIFAGALKFRLLCQTALDVATSDIVALTDDDTTTGIYVLFQQLLSVIRFWDRCDGQGNSYLTQALRIGTGPMEPHRDAKHAEYVSMDLPAEYKICIGLGRSGQ